MKKKIGVLSDLHLESSNIDLKDLNCDILILAGDISQDFNLLDRLFSYNINPEIKKIYIPGNHEYEGKRFNEVKPKLKELEKIYENLHVLQNEYILIDNIKFIGSTLWSNFEGNGYLNKEENKKWAKYNIVDFTYIFKEEEIENKKRYVPWNPDDMEKEFQKSYDFIKYETRENRGQEKTFVITHFAPHQLSVHKKYTKSMNSSYWVNNLEELLGYSDYWIHGHVHDSFNYNIEGTEVICNPRGYSNMYNLSQNDKFNKNYEIEVEVNLKNKPKVI